MWPIFLPLPDIFHLVEIINGNVNILSFFGGRYEFCVLEMVWILFHRHKERCNTITAHDVCALCVCVRFFRIFVLRYLIWTMLSNKFVVDKKVKRKKRFHKNRGRVFLTHVGFYICVLIESTSSYDSDNLSATIIQPTQHHKMGGCVRVLFKYWKTFIYFWNLSVAYTHTNTHLFHHGFLLYFFCIKTFFHAFCQYAFFVPPLYWYFH